MDRRIERHHFPHPGSLPRRNSMPALLPPPLPRCYPLRSPGRAFAALSALEIHPRSALTPPNAHRFRSNVFLRAQAPSQNSAVAAHSCDRAPDGNWCDPHSLPRLAPGKAEPAGRGQRSGDPAIRPRRVFCRPPICHRPSRRPLPSGLSLSRIHYRSHPHWRDRGSHRQDHRSPPPRIHL